MLGGDAGSPGTGFVLAGPPGILATMSLGTDTPASTTTSETEPAFVVTDAALAKVLEIRGAEDEPESLCLWIEVTGTQGVDYTYDLSFETIADLEPTDHRVPVGGDLIVAIPEGSVDQLRGATLDLPANAGQGGLVLRNPNRPNPLAGADLELTGDIADKVAQLLEQSINPSLASHGGYATLVGRRRHQGLPDDGRWLPGLLDERGHPGRGHPGGHQGGDPRGHRDHRRHRPRRRREPLLHLSRRLQPSRSTS